MSIWKDGSELPDAGHDLIMDYGDLSYELNRGGRYPDLEEERPVRWVYLQDLIAAAERGEKAEAQLALIEEACVKQLVAITTTPPEEA